MKTYFCYIEYFATGEDLTFAIGVSRAKTEREAKVMFCKQHMVNNPNDTISIKYFLPGVEAFNFKTKKNHTKIKNIMANFFSAANIDHVFTALDNNALFDFYYKSYVNYS